MADRWQQGGQRRLDNLRQKRREVKAWGAGGSASAGLAPAGRALSDAGALAAVQRRRQAHKYALSSSSSSSDSEEGTGDAGQPPVSAEVATAKLFAKLGLRGGPGSHATSGGGFDSDSSWASSPDRGRIKAVGGNSSSSSASVAGMGGPDGGNASEQLHAELARARSTILALQEELAAARAQADSTMPQLRATELFAEDLQAQLQAAQQELAMLRSATAGASCTPAAAAEEAAPTGEVAAMQELLAANSLLQQQVEEMCGQLAAAAAWQQEVRAMQAQLAGMQQVVAESEAGHQLQEQELAALLQQREQELMEAAARAAAAEAQVIVLQGGEAGGHPHLSPAAELLAQFAVTHAQLVAALSEAAAVLS